MHLRQFYESLLPSEGIYLLFTTKDKRNYWAHSIDELVEKTESLAGRTDVYYDVATLKEVIGEHEGRSQANTDRLKCFKLDLDAGEKKLKTQGPAKVYVDQPAAIAAFVEFTKQTGLVFSTLVSSGEGLHVYYALDESITPEQWLPVAKALQKFGKAHGLKIDSSVTKDYARVLRPVGTLHPNGKTVSALKHTGKVYTLDEFADKVGAVPEETRPSFDNSINDDLGLTVQGPPKSIKKILLRCDAMATAYRDQEHVEEPYWRLALGVCKHTVEGIEAAKVISQRHPKYDEDDLIEKYERWETGPSTCESFSEYAEESCNNCPHRGKIKSPVQLGAMNVEEVEQLPPEAQPEEPKQTPQTGKPWDGCIPPNFDVVSVKGELTLVHNTTIQKENEFGEMVPIKIQTPITHDIFWFGQWADANDSDDTAQVVIHKMDRSIKRSYLMEQTLVASRTDLTKYLASKGIHLTTDKRAPTSMEAYAKAQLQRIKNAMQRPKITDRFGLRILEDGTMVAAHGKYLIYPNGAVEEAMLAKSLRAEAQHYHIPLPENEEGVWQGTVWKNHILPSAKAHVDFMRKYYAHPGFEKYQLAIMLAIASPLMAFVTDGYWKGATLPPNGLSLALFSENGGKGKTTAMRCAQLAYGLPSGLNKDNDDLNTTSLGRLARFSISGTMPVNMDEMGDMDAKSLATLVRTIANGSGRVRATKDGGLSVSSPWSLICLIGTNKSQREIIAQIRKESSAEQFRLLELDVEKMPQFGVEAQTAFESEWKTMSQHAGALGALVHLLICGMGVEGINKLVSEKVIEAAHLVQAVRVESASRFQYRALGALLTLHELLDKRGLAPFDKGGLIEEFLTAYRLACEFVDDNIVTTDGTVLLAKMLQDLQPYTIITEKETRRTGFHQAYDIDVRGKPPVICKVRHVLEDRRSYVSSEAIQEWCHLNKVRESVIINAAKAYNLLLRVYPGDAKGSDSDHGVTSRKRWSARYNLFKGMRESTGGMVACYCFNVRALAQHLGEDLDIQLVQRHAPEVIELRPAEQAA
jgi:hypothetical protein